MFLLSHKAVSQFSLSVAQGLDRNVPVENQIVFATNSFGGRGWHPVCNDEVKFIDGDSFTRYAVFGVGKLNIGRWESATSEAGLEVELINPSGFFMADYAPGSHQSRYANIIFGLLEGSLDSFYQVLFSKEEFYFISDEERKSSYQKLLPMYISLIQFEAKLNQWHFAKKEIECKANFLSWDKAQEMLDTWLSQNPGPNAEEFINGSDWGLSLYKNLLELELERAYEDAHSDES